MTKSKYVVQRLPVPCSVPHTPVLFCYQVVLRYGEQARKRYKKTHGRPILLTCVATLARAVAEGLNNGKLYTV